MDMCRPNIDVLSFTCGYCRDYTTPRFDEFAECAQLAIVSQNEDNSTSSVGCWRLLITMLIWPFRILVSGV